MKSDGGTIPTNVGRNGVWSPELDMPKDDPKERTCLKCSSKFKSKNKFNRICDTCKNKKEHSEW